ncbi:unnamed protein product [Parnassius apollo]|uniref:(apollo) hypothetical protein n=1 Tax=Parnassius apollo TaxID=110799 RepID=A0A8S3WDS5_PARAO|nr:unnamed protein product [Parnassius apollo]
MENHAINLNFELPNDAIAATKSLLEIFLTKLYPYLQKIGDNIQSLLKDGNNLRDNAMNIHNLFILCVSQINKSYLTMIDVLKIEHHMHILLQESRQCTLERISWCCSRLVSIEQKLEAMNNKEMYESCLDDLMFESPKYFVNWIDQTFDVLESLVALASDDRCKGSQELNDYWKDDMVDCVSSLHTSMDELLLSAMTLCRHCLPADQPIIKARCQVVLRETKALLSEIIEGDINTVFEDKIVPLKLPIRPSNINVLIDVLKDVLYVLETNTNTALLALLIHCFSYSVSPVDVLKEHYVGSNKGICECAKSDDITTETCCTFVKEFDLHNERLLHIGLFAVSCSSDDKRILALRSNLASLEALDPHLVPALIMSPESHHSMLLMSSWNKEVSEIRDGVFLIVDPAAFAGKVRQMMHQKLLEILKDKSYDNNKICSVINMGCVAYDFFNVYNKHEPDAINEREKLLPLLSDLHKVQLECKVVSDLLSSGNDFVYNIKKTKSIENNTSIEQMHKRLKLLYTIVNRINVLLHPEEHDEFFADEEEGFENNVTHTVCVKKYKTYVNTPKIGQKILSKSIFGRTTNLRSSSKTPLFKLTKHMKHKKIQNLNFTIELDEACNASDFKAQDNRDSLTFFYSPLKKRPSLRMAVLNRHKLNVEKETFDESKKICEENTMMDESLGLQITEVLNQINDLTTTFCARTYQVDSTVQSNKYDKNRQGDGVLRLNDNDKMNTTVTKHIWNIPINTSGTEPDSSTLTSNISQPSNVTTLERLNDLDLVESKLSSLRVMQMETSL